MSNRDDREILVPISLRQAERVVQQVLEGTAPGMSLVRLLLALSGQDRMRLTELTADSEYQDRKNSQTLLTGLLVLSVFHGGADHGVNGIAHELGMSPSTAIRYLKTWVAIGVLEQVTATRRYRIARQWAPNEVTTTRFPPNAPRRPRVIGS
jgi:IclR helix-turn-helix domain